ncbi:MAG: hypothetical protein QOG34_313 [Frankiaceae bacterium]|nr:hypothetical protein [Frankiaceae bacterium]
MSGYGATVETTAATPGTTPVPRRVLACAAAGLVVFATWVAFSVGGTTVTTAVDDLGTVAAVIFAAIQCFAAARRVDARTRRFWLLLAAAMAAWAFGEGAWAVYDLALDQSVPTPSYADLGYLGAIPLAAVALLSHPAHRRAGKTRAILDGSILATALLFLSWTYVLGPVWQQNDITTSAGIVSVAYPFGDVVLVFLLARVLLYLDHEQRRAVGLVLVGLLAMALSDSAYTYLTAVRAYATGNLIDVGWVVAYLAIAAGAAIAERSGTTTTSTVFCRTAAPNDAVGLLAPFLPVLLSLGVVGLRVRSGTTLDDASLLLAFALTSLVLLRQGLAAVRPVHRS